MVQIKISSKDRIKGSQQAEKMGDLAQKIIQTTPGFRKTIQVFGPLESPLPRIATRYRWQMLLKGLHLSHLRDFIQQLLFDSQADRPRRDVSIAVDVDPFFMM